MPKSTLKPINKTANDIEIKFKVPTDTVANPAVRIKPVMRLMSVEITSVVDFNPQYKRIITNETDKNPANPRPSITLLSSS